MSSYQILNYNFDLTQGDGAGSAGGGVEIGDVVGVLFVDRSINSGPPPYTWWKKVQSSSDNWA